MKLIIQAAMLLIVMSASMPSRAVGAPDATTSLPSALVSSSATLNGSGNPNGENATGWFRYSTSDPGTCNDSFGTRLPSFSANDTALGSGSSPVAYSQSVTGLLPGTSYYYCAIVQNASGTAFGSVLSLTTSAALPTVTSGLSSNRTGTTATLNGTVNPGGDATTGWFRYSTVSPGSCNDTFGSRAPASGGSAIPAGSSSVAYSQAISGLTPGTAYFYCAIAQNSVGTALGTIRTFTTPLPPVAATSVTTNISNSSATLNGQANPNGSTTTGWFRYAATDPGSCNDSFGSRAPLAGGSSLGSGTSNQPYSQAITGLSPSTTYYYCSIASSAEGTAFGTVLSFTTANAPTAATFAASNVASGSATLSGSGNPNLGTATGWFRYSTSDPGVCTDSFGTRLPSSSFNDSALGSGSTPVPYAQSVTGLLPGTGYYYCAISSNAYGSAFGSVLSFTTQPSAPTVLTGGSTNRTGTAATLNASANPGGATTTGWFRYGTTSPGTCNDSFGTRAPASGGNAIPAGTSTVAYSQGITGLIPGTTYYYCAIAQNSVGTALGSVISFTTPLPPVAATSAATNISNSSATLNGSGNPNGAASTGWFRYAVTNPGSCNDSFGSRAPASGGSSLGSGTSNQAYSQSISSLSPGATYYYCSIASSAEGTAFGAVLSFTMATTPLATTSAATNVASSSATLNGSGTPNLGASTGWFRYSTSDPGSCNDSFGTRLPSSSFNDTALGSGGSPVAYAQSVTGLLPGSTYYYCAVTANPYGTAFGSIISFTTLPALPTVTTGISSNRTGTAATLNASANPGGATTTGWFRYSTTSPGTCNDSFGTRAPASGGSVIPAGTSSVAYSQGITGLSPGTTYYYCAIGQNSVGTALGSVISFTTPLPPVAATSAATNTSNSSATLNGSGNPNGSTTTGWFRYAATNPGTCDDIFGSRAPLAGGSSLGSGTSNQAYSQSISSLSPGTTYYYCAITSSAEGTAFGGVLSLTTANTPTVSTSAATTVTSSGATLNGTGTPNLNATFGYYRYSTTNPGTCSDIFGTRSPATGAADSYLGAGSSAVPYNQTLSGLSPATTYYYCAISYNAYGTGFGSVVSFTTLAAAPSVTTGTSSNRTGTTATLNGTVNPGGDATTGWFRYGTVSPGSCNDSFGTRAPASGGSAIPAGTSSVAYSQGITGLISGTTYYYCAIAQNSVGTALGSVISFTTPLPPVAATSAATNISNSSATLNGSGNPNGSAATGWFRYAVTNPGSCNDSFGSRAPASGGSSLGSGTSNQAYSQGISGLSPGTTYYFCAITSSAEGTALGAVLSLTTTPVVPVLPLTSVSAVSEAGATLEAAVIPGGADTTGWFRYSTSNPGVCNDSFGTRAPATGGSSIPAGTSSTNFSQAITGLTPGTSYYFCPITQNSAGIAFGPVFSFNTLQQPLITTVAASVITDTTATLNGQGNPGGAATVAWFRYAVSDPGTCNDTFGSRAPANGGSSLGSGTVLADYSQGISGLTPGTTYYYCAMGQNQVGMSFGSVASFTTPMAPTVTTTEVVSVSSSGATLAGLGNPNLAAAKGWFRYATSDPGTCDDTFGTRLPSSSASDTVLGSASSGVAYYQSASGLPPGTTFYYCALAANAYGTTYGAVRSFTTDPVVPVLPQTSVSAVAETGATLEAAVITGGADTTVWFRYSTSNPGVCNDTFGTRAPDNGGSSIPAGTSSTNFSQIITGLSQGTTYYFCPIAENVAGIAFGPVFSFTTRVPMNLIVTITGSGSVTSQNGNGINDTCNSGTCEPVAFHEGDIVTLTATGSNSSFAAWSGACDGSSNPCTISMDGDKTVGVTFDPDPARVKIDVSSAPYYLLGEALAASPEPVQPNPATEIRAQATPDFAETITLTNPVPILLRGGYGDPDFTTQIGVTTISGWLKIQAGKLTVEWLKIKP